MSKINQVASSDYPKTSEIGEDLLKAITQTPPTKQVYVHFRFNSGMEYHEWLTRKQYFFLKEVKCIEFCKILASN